MFEPPARQTPSRRRLRRALSPVLLVVAMVAALVGLTATPAQAVSKWNSGSTKYTTITNCPSIIWGNPYQEFGIGAFVSYWGDQQSSPVTPRVGETTYLDTYAMLIGSHCGTPKIFPRFVLPEGVEFDRTQVIKCYYTPPGGTQLQVTDATECPQWGKVTANGYYSNDKAGWGSGWPLPSGQNYTNGSAWEFLVPVKVVSQQWGSPLRTQLAVADGNAGPTLDLTVPFYTGPAPTTLPGAPTNAAATVLSPRSARVAFHPPADTGGTAITSYRLQCSSPDGAPTRVKDGTSSPLTITTLSPGTTYRCRVQAVNAVGRGSYSPYTATFDTPADVPSRPTGVTAVATTSTSAQVSFPAPADNGSAITTYRTQCVSTDGGVTGYGSAAGSPVLAQRLTPGRNYHCRVQATNGVGNSTWSAFSPTFRLPA